MRHVGLTRTRQPVSFTQEDPIGLAGGLNLYGFAGGDPVNFGDPFGLRPCPPDNDCGFDASDAAAVFGRLSQMAPAMRTAIVGGTAVAVAPAAAVIAADAAGTAGMTRLGLSGANRMVTFFRGVGAEEAAQISSEGVLKEAAGQSIEGAKYLTNTVESAARWAARIHREAGQVARVQVPRAAARTFEYLGRIDGIGEAWIARMEQLTEAVARMLPK